VYVTLQVLVKINVLIPGSVTHIDRGISCVVSDDYHHHYHQEK